MTRTLPALIVLLFAAACFGQGRAVILVGTPGSPMYQRHYEDRVKRFDAVLKKAGIADVTTISNKPAAEVLAGVKTAVGASKPDEQFVLVILGHGQAGDAGVTLVTPGADLQVSQLAEALKPLKSRSQVILNFAASAGDALPLLAQPGRVNLAAGSATQVNDNDLAEFVLLQLEADAKKPLLDVYNQAVLEWAKWTVRQKKATGEGAVGWLVEGKASAAISKKLYGGPDVPDDRKFAPSADADKPDQANPPLMSDGKPYWANRRLVTENPSIDDTGGKAPPASPLSEKGFTAVAPSSEQPNGAVAAKTVLGTP
jgi:hypothetical protein